jgi:hypothetical protein
VINEALNVLAVVLTGYDNESASGAHLPRIEAHGTGTRRNSSRHELGMTNDE